SPTDGKTVRPIQGFEQRGGRRPDWIYPCSESNSQQRSGGRLTQTLPAPPRSDSATATTSKPASALTRTRHRPPANQVFDTLPAMVLTSPLGFPVRTYTSSVRHRRL